MPEQQNIEWKESWRDEYLKWICGFANTQGGNLTNAAMLLFSKDPERYQLGAFLKIG